MNRKPFLTHNEACKLVEKWLERCIDTLSYIRLKLKDNPDYVPYHLALTTSFDRANLLCRVNNYGSYIAGALQMYRALENNGFFEYKKTKSDWLISQAQLKLYMENTQNTEWLLHGLPDNIQMYVELTRDKKGKIIAAKAKFRKTYEEDI